MNKTRLLTGAEEKLLKENKLLQQILKWTLKHGAYHDGQPKHPFYDFVYEELQTHGCGCCSDRLEVPEEFKVTLDVIIAELIEDEARENNREEA